MTSTQLIKERYQIKKLLGTQYTQQTLLALDRKTQNLVVIKLLPLNRNLERETYRLFEREAKILQELQHVAIPSYLDYFDVETKYGKSFALVQSYVNAPSLEEYVKKGRIFNEAELKKIAQAILKILIYLHNRYRPIIHRDIKPSNILLTNRSSNNGGQIYLVGFGSVQAAANQLGIKTIVGTYGYMPPEQFGRFAVFASDLYGLGTTLIYLASGRDPADLPQKDLQVSFEDVVDLSPGFTDWLRSITAPSLDRRLSSAEEAMEALSKLAFSQYRNRKLASLTKSSSRKILIDRDDSWEITLPPRSFNFVLIVGILFTVICDVSVIVFWGGLIFDWISEGWSIFLKNWYFLLVALPHLYISFWLTKKILLKLYRHYQLLKT
jgi:serine/threonine protein kinase